MVERPQRQRPQRQSSQHCSATNKANFACFACRVAYKQLDSVAWDLTAPARAFPCPNCGMPMTRMGKYLKAPPRRAARQWLKAELLYQYGERFQSSRSGLEKKCPTLTATVAYLVQGGHAEHEVRDRIALLNKIRAQ